MKKLFSIIVITALLIIQLTTPVLACEAEPRTQGYWKNHVCEWQCALQNDLCGYTWQEVLNTPAKGDAWYILAHQWIAYKLNCEYKYCTLKNELGEAKEYLDYGPGNIPEDSRPMAIDLAEKLDAFNNGFLDQ